MSILFSSLTKTAIATTLESAAYAGKKTAALPLPTLSGKAHEAWAALKGLGGYAMNPEAAQLQAQNQNLHEQMRRTLPAALLGGGLAGAALMAHAAQKKREAEPKTAWATPESRGAAIGALAGGGVGAAYALQNPTPGNMLHAFTSGADPMMARALQTGGIGSLVGAGAGALAGHALRGIHHKKKHADCGPVMPATTGAQSLTDKPGYGGLLADRVRQVVEGHKVPLALGAGAMGGGLLGAAFARHHEMK